jgi:hypothetical protein
MENTMTSFVTYERTPRDGYLNQYLEVLVECMFLDPKHVRGVMDAHRRDVTDAKKSAVREAMERVRAETHVITADINHR